VAVAALRALARGNYSREGGDGSVLSFKEAGALGHSHDARGGRGSGIPP